MVGRGWRRALAAAAIGLWGVWTTVGPVAAATIVAGERYRGSIELEAPNLGVGFTLPEGWVGQLPEGADMFVMTPDDRSYVFATADEMSVEGIRTVFARPLELGNGIVLRPKGPATVDGETVGTVFDVTGTPEPYAGEARARVGAHGVGIGFIAVGPAAEREALSRVLERLVAGVTFAAPRQPPEQEAGDGTADDWATYMRGRYIARLYTNSGYGEKDEFWLCSDGSFRHVDHAYGDAGVYHREHFGRWQATGTGNDGTLVLGYDDGSTANRQLQYRDDKLYLDGTQYLRGANSYCP
jgi:hypothetical protein